MLKVVFAAALAVGLVIAPMPQIISSAAAQQKATASDKNAKTKKEPSAGQAAGASGRKNVPPSGRKRKPPTRSIKERPGQNSGVTATNVSSPLPNSSGKILSGLQRT